MTNFLERITPSYFYQHVTEPTRCRVAQKLSLIDLIFTNIERMVSDIEYSSLLGKSDHCVLKFSFNCYCNPGQNFKTRYMYEKGDYSNMKDYLNRDWDIEFADSNGDVEKQ